jgi:hypothetical protein
MSRIQTEFLPCPFCDKGQIECGYIPSVWGEKRRGRNALGSGKAITKSSEEWLIKSGCNVCGKSTEEVEKELRKQNII